MEDHIKKMVEEINAEAASIRREELIQKHGVEKAEEILLSEEPGQTRYVMDGEEDPYESNRDFVCGNALLGRRR